MGGTVLKGVGWLFLIVLGFSALSWGLGLIGAASKVASTPQRVIERAFDTENVIHKYEWFHDVVTQQVARVSQIAQFKGFLTEEEHGPEKQRLRMEMAAQQMSCRDLVAKYNANSEKMNVSVFKGWSLPDRLNPSDCE